MSKIIKAKPMNDNTFSKYAHLLRSLCGDYIDGSLPRETFEKYLKLAITEMVPESPMVVSDNQLTRTAQ